MPDLGIHTFAIAPEWDTSAMIGHAEILKRHRVKVLEIPLLRPDAFDAAGARAFAAENGFDLVASLGLPAWINLVDDPDRGLAFLDMALRVTRDMGSKTLSGVTYAAIGKTTGQPATAAEKTAMYRFLDQAAARAARYGLRLGIEPCNRYETHLMNTAADAVACIEAVGAENLFIHLDTYHMHIEEKSYAEGFGAAAPHLGYVHLSESNRGVPGQGMVNWPAVMQALHAIGYDGVITLESMNHVDRDIAGGLAIWRPVAEPPEDVMERGIPFLRRMAASAGLEIS